MRKASLLVAGDCKKETGGSRFRENDEGRTRVFVPNMQKMLNIRSCGFGGRMIADAPGVCANN